MSNTGNESSEPQIVEEALAVVRAEAERLRPPSTLGERLGKIVRRIGSTVGMMFETYGNVIALPSDSDVPPKDDKTVE